MTVLRFPLREWASRRGSRPGPKRGRAPASRPGSRSGSNTHTCRPTIDPVSGSEQRRELADVEAAGVRRVDRRHHGGVEHVDVEVDPVAVQLGRADHASYAFDRLVGVGRDLRGGDDVGDERGHLGEVARRRRGSRRGPCRRDGSTAPVRRSSRPPASGDRPRPRGPHRRGRGRRGCCPGGGSRCGRRCGPGRSRPRRRRCRPAPTSRLQSPPSTSARRSAARTSSRRSARAACVADDRVLVAQPRYGVVGVVDVAAREHDAVLTGAELPELRRGGRPRGAPRAPWPCRARRRAPVVEVRGWTALQRSRARGPCPVRLLRCADPRLRTSHRRSALFWASSTRRRS